MRSYRDPKRGLRSRVHPAKPAVPARPYHHGTLQEALIAATESILAERGVEGFSLREAARRAGVSPAAPSHHFESATGLLTEVAIRGFEALREVLSEADGAGGDPAARLRHQGVAYVRFALAHSGRFQLMFRKSWLKPKSERLQLAVRAAHAEVENTMRDYLAARNADVSARAVSIAMLGAWSLVHGFANLALDGKFDQATQGIDRDTLIARELPAVLASLWP